MRVLVSGATGFIGRHVLQALAGRPEHSLLGLSRRPRAAAGRDEPGGIEWRQGDVSDPTSLAEAVRGVECVVHSVQFPNHPVEKPSRGHTYIEVDGRGTENLARACAEAGVRRFVYFSGAGVRPDRPENWFRAKWMAETAVRESGMEWVILQPSWIYGPGDRAMNRFVLMTKYLPLIPVIGDGTTRIQPSYVGDVAEVAAQAVSLPEAAGEVFELGGPQQLSMNEILRTVQRVLGKRKPLVHFPVPLMKVAAAAMQVLPAPPLSPAAIDFILKEEKVDPSRAEALFGVRFRPLEEGLSYLREG